MPLLYIAIHLFLSAACCLATLRMPERSRWRRVLAGGVIVLAAVGMLAERG